MKKTTMKNKFSNFITALKAENIKKSGTGFYWTGVALAFLSPLLFFIVAIYQSTDEVKTGIPYNHYMRFMEGSVQPFAYFFFPLFIIISVSRITQIDHKNGGWQLMETQPTYKFSIYFSKFTTILIANLISIISFVVFSVFASWILTFIIPLPKITLVEIPFSILFHLITRLFIAAILITAIQYLISVLLSSFIWSIIIGFFGLLLTTFLSPFKLTPVWYPFEILSKVADTTKGSQLEHWFLYTEYIGIVASIVFLYVGFQWYQHKQFRLAFLNKSSKIISLLGILVVGGGLLFWLLKPNQMNNYKTTIICGKIESDNSFHIIYIKDAIVHDTIAVIPVVNNEFHYQFKNKVITDYYEINIDGKYGDKLFFGSNDSIYVASKIYNNKTEFDFKGTRLAENQMDANTQESWSTVNYYIEENQNLDQPKIIIDALYKEWKDAIKEPNKFRTVDNFIGKNDFKERAEKLTTTKYMNLWYELVKKRKALYPNEKTIETEDIKEIKSKLPLDDESLLSSEEYFNYIRSQLIIKNNQDINYNLKALQEIAKLKKGSFKDKMLFWQLNKSLEDASNSEERNKLVTAYNSNFGNSKYQSKINNINKVLESLGKGKVAPLFQATNLEGKTVSLADLKGKFVVIDVWATWCGPCKQQAPYFEKMALKYKSTKIQFIGLSVDEDIKKWFIDAKSKSKATLQIHSNDKNAFGKNYSMESIPRFILIDPNGKFINAKMPRPEEPAFEIILRKELHLQDEKE
ncbi:MAG: hypothetical protein RIQ59_399 [Bacteroidota bacterium]|jgi:thiol-disulfide isomerase/thioredoxin